MVCTPLLSQSCPFHHSSYLLLGHPSPSLALAVTPLSLAVMALHFFWAFHSHPCPAGCVDGHMGGRSDPECGLGIGHRCGLLHDDCGLPHPEVRVEIKEIEMGVGENRVLGVTLQPGQAGNLTPASCLGCSAWPLDWLKGRSSTGHSKRTTRWVGYSQTKGRLDPDVPLII